MDSTPKKTDLANQKQTPAQRQRRKIAREVAAMYDDIARAAGLEPSERRTAFAISALLYEYDNAAPDTPRRLTLVSIGKWLTSKSDDEEACRQAATRQVGHLFNHAIPRTGYQILARYKSEQGSNRAHEYGHDRIMQAAAFFSEVLAEERRAILANKGIEKGEKHQMIDQARARLIADALGYLPPCDAELVTPEGEVYAYLAAPEAKAYSAKNPEFTVRPKSYTPPDKKAAQPRPLYSQDFDRIEAQIERAIENSLDKALKLNSFDEARNLAVRIERRVPKLIASWLKIAGARPRKEEDDEHEELYARDKFDMPDPVENVDDAGAPSHDNLSCEARSNSFADNADENESLESDPVENWPEPAPAIVGSINFDESLEAAIFYARDGWNVLPICNFSPETGRCTASWHAEDCAGKKPLAAGKGERKPGDGYTAATRDLARIRHWWGTKYPDAGVGIRLDDHVLIDADLKDGGPESYEFIRDTFALPETLTAVTQGGGNHFVFRLLPESLELLKSWTRILDKIALPGIDLKVGKCGLLYAEPTRGKKGNYRWIDPTVEPATLPHEAAEFFHSIRYQEEKQNVEKKSKTSRVFFSTTPAPFDPDQAKYFRDVPRGGGQHARLLKIARLIRAGGGDADQIRRALNYHAAHFSEPLDDQKWIDRVAADCCAKYAPEVMT